MASRKISEVILCTGANRSLGFAILQVAALRMPSASYILACRSAVAGQEAVGELRTLGVKADIQVLELDVANDGSIFKAVEWVRSKFGKLDVLINNAGIAIIPRAADLSDFRAAYDDTLSTNVSSAALLTAALQPLLHKASSPRVINVSSARGSLTFSTTGNPPPTVAMAYSISKTALNALTIELQRTENAGKEVGPKIQFYVVSPGHLKTAFNGFRGTKDPLDGAEVIVRLIEAEAGEFEGGSFWEFEGGVMKQFPW